MHICWLYTAAVEELALSRLFYVAVSVLIKHYSHFKQLSRIVAIFRIDMEETMLCRVLCVQWEWARENRGLLQPCPVYTKEWMAINVPNPGHGSRVLCTHLNSVYPNTHPGKIQILLVVTALFLFALLWTVQVLIFIFKHIQYCTKV